jgi:hypothetical protein
MFLLVQLWMRSLGLAPPSQPRGDVTALARRVLAGSMTQPMVTTGPASQMVQAESTSQPYRAPISATSQAKPTAAAPDLAMDAAAAPVDQQAPAEAQATAQSAAPHRAAAAAAAAAAALAKLGDGAHKADAAQRAGVVVVRETRNFAGKHVEIEREFQAGSKAADNATQRAAATGGLDAALKDIHGLLPLRCICRYLNERKPRLALIDW